MGVRSLWRILKPSAERVVPSGIRLAVDTSIWICQYGHLGSDDIVYFFSKRVIKLLYHGIQPVFVFDGRAPEIKRQAILERRKRSNRSSIVAVDRMLRGRRDEEKGHDGHKPVIFGEGRYNWGDFFESDSDSYLFEYETSSSEDALSSEQEEQRDGLEPSINFDFIESKDLSRTQKLKRLVELRGRRKEIRTRGGTNDPDTFSRLQIKNLRTRNLISHNIKILEEKGYKRVHGDCKSVYKLTKKSDGSKNPIVKDIDRPADRESSWKSELCMDSDSSSQEDEMCIGIDQSLEQLESYPTLKSLVDKHRVLEDSPKEKNEDTEGANKIDAERVSSISSVKERMMGGFFVLDDGTESLPESSERCVEERHGSLFGSRKVLGEAGQENRDISRALRIIKDVLDVFNISYVDAPTEADSQCGFMCYSNIVDGVITEDNDVLLYGGTIFRNFFRKDREIEKYSLEKIEEELKLDRKNLIELSHLLGSDYTPGVRGIGPVKALDAVRKGTVREEDVKVLMELYMNPVAADVKGILDPVIDKDKIRMFYKNSGVSEGRIDGVMRFLSNLKLA
ncbi:DNA repair flap endonuclease [Encephalitozoon hellem ATCC 50504]|uniref:DNA repair protein RAD2 n=1 Tax=Encephalitozoon hellem TaxID=27973 RepID=A0A9Q9C8V4_ENCHE|nr:DNA repair flap endonuclease [Encephalitozoon hellem ATCC 50504]AFM99057.1 DNA repair flap endonuclease [Encephalitozoon hellem ATCC 50504]UTX42463.1 DNA repair protein RAD2 [Encephalitozoon hellem]WEL37908.1 DNA repair protein RAD2 [Encephalitozoon hellem]|eukprot:XP_003888038.1 DNA repair flap endonuclease [Encephalitozoon hellem ATCC 50504]